MHAYGLLNQQLIVAAVADQAAATRSGLEFIQVGANKTALEVLCEQKDTAYQRALAEFEEGNSSTFIHPPDVQPLRAAHQVYTATKAEAKEKRDVSVALVRGMDREFQDQFAEMEAVRWTLFFERCG